MSKFMAYRIIPGRKKLEDVPKAYFAGEPIYWETVTIEEPGRRVFDLDWTMRRLRAYLHAEIDEMK